MSFFVSEKEKMSHCDQVDLFKRIDANTSLGESIIKDIQHGSEVDPEQTLKCLNGLMMCLQKTSYFAREIHDDEKRRKDQWDILDKKLKTDPMFEESWKEILMLMKLEEPNI